MGKEVRVQPPYFSVLGLDESKFRLLRKDDIWKAFFARKCSYKKTEEGALTEELQNPDDAVDWDLTMEAFHVLIDQEARAEYEQRNLMPHAQRQLQGLRVVHEAQARDWAILEAEAKAKGFGSVAEMRAAEEQAAREAAEAAAREAEEAAAKGSKKGKK